MIELLAPVGSREALTAAVASGADAVYMGGKLFGARQYAPNFSDEELAEAVRYAHLYGVSVYITVNTLLDNSELPALEDYLRHLYDIGVDAILVQDLGVAAVARRVVPGLPLHSSTQMTVNNLAGVQLLAQWGFTRAVLARELSLEEIRYIAKNSPIEIEIFVHGALCVCYSGQCLMSSMIGGRSGNRGRCAQPCRLPYALVDKNGKDVLVNKDAGEYLLSPKDFNTMELLPELMDAGVVSYKIEGRMKRPEYVAVVVDTYRRAIDAYRANRDNYTVVEQDQKDLAQIFNRGFTTAYLTNRPGRLMISDRRPNNRGVRIGRVIEYHRDSQTVVIKLDEPLFTGDILEFWVKVGGRSSATVTSMMVNGQSVDSALPGTEVAIPVQAAVRPNDRVFKTFDSRLMERARSFFAGAGQYRRIGVRVTATVEEGQPLTIRLEDENGFVGEGRTQFIAEAARKRPLTAETIAKQVGRLGTTVFDMRELDCRIEGEVMVPVSEINEARRLAVEQLEEARLAKFVRPPLKLATGRISRDVAALADQKRPPVKPQLVVNVDTLEKLKSALAAGADWILFGGERFDHRPVTLEDYRQALNWARAKGKHIVFALPRLVKDALMLKLAQIVQEYNALKPDGISVGNLGTLHLVKEHSDLPIFGDYPLNIYNSLTLQFLKEQGVQCATLSPELNFSQLETLSRFPGMQLECLVHGYLTLMISEYCVLGSFLGDVHKGNCTQPCLSGEYRLKDRMNETFPVVTDQYCRMHILNAKELSMFAHIPRFGRMGIDRIRIEGKKATPEEVAITVARYREILDLGDKHPLLVQDKVDTIEHNNVTRGHYFRGVL